MRNYLTKLTLAVMVAFATITTSCSSDPAELELDQSLTPDRTLTFTATIDGATRGASLSDMGLLYYVIYAYNDYSDEWFMDGVTMTYENNEWRFNYDGLISLPTHGTSYFFSYSDQVCSDGDQTKSGVTFNKNGANSTVSYSMPEDILSQPDLIMSPPVAIESSSDTFVINFKFEYLLAMVKFSTSGDYTINNITMANFVSDVEIGFSEKYSTDSYISTTNYSGESFNVDIDPTNSDNLTTSTGYLFIPAQSTVGLTISYSATAYDTDGTTAMGTLEKSTTLTSGELTMGGTQNYNIITGEFVEPEEVESWNLVTADDGSSTGEYTEDLLVTLISYTTQATKEVEIYESSLRPGYYRIKNVYTEDYTSLLFDSSNTYNIVPLSDDQEIYTYIDATDPDAVWVEYYNTGCYISDAYGYFYYGSNTPDNFSDDSSATAASYGTLKDGYISFPEGSIYATLSNFGGPWRISNGRFSILLPGGTDPYEGEDEEEEESTPGTSTDYSKDGEVTKLHSATKGNDLSGINFVIMGDGFIDTDMTEGGTYETLMEDVAGYLLAVEPLKSYADYVNIYAVKAVSEENSIGTSYNTALSTYTGSGTSINGDDDTVFNYARLVDSKLDLTETVIVVIANSTSYSGTTTTYTSGRSIAYTSLMSGYSRSTFANVVRHESVGHGFGRLLDEYIYSYSSITDSYITNFNNSRNYFNMGYNLTIDESDIPWEHFIGLDGYDMVANYEGGYFFQYGVWRSEYNSCMNDNVPYFSAISRELMVQRIKEQAGETYSFDDFVANDVTDYITTVSTNAYYSESDLPIYIDIESSLPPLAPPVFIDDMGDM